jgi:uncharacterized protein YjiS (DUF1127 family)
MSCADKSHATLSAIAPPLPSRTWPGWPPGVWRRFRHALELRRQRHTLRELDDRQLDDIGITREQALREANKLFWPRI